MSEEGESLMPIVSIGRTRNSFASKMMFIKEHMNGYKALKKDRLPQ